MSELRITTCESIDALPRSARDLWLRAEPQLQFDQTLAWNEILVRHALEPGERVRVVCAEREPGHCVGVLPLKLMPTQGVWRVRSVRALANYYCSLYAPILEGGEDERAEVLRALLGHVATWSLDALDLNPLADEPAQAAAIRSCLQGQGWVAHPYFRFGNWYLEVGGRTFAEYFASLPSQLRNTVTRKEKKLLKEPGVTITIAQTPQEAQLALEGYQKIYAASWKQPEPHPLFVPALVRMLAERGWLRMGLVTAGGEPIASQIWACKDGVVSIFKLAYDERYAQLSAGSVLTTHLMRHVIDGDRAGIVDYLTGDDAYKRDWMSHRRERVGVHALRKMSWRAAGARLTDAVAAGLKRLRPKSPAT